MRITAMSQKSAFENQPPEFRQQLGARVRRMVDEVGPVAEVAKQIGLSTRQLAAYCGGEHAPGFIPMARLSVLSGFSLGWLMTGVGAERTNHPPAQRKTSGEPPSDKHRVLAFAQELRVLYEGAGLPLSGEDELSVVGDAIEAIETSGLSGEWASAVGIFLESHRQALVYSLTRLRKTGSSKQRRVASG